MSAIEINSGGLLNEHEAAERLGVSVSLLRKLRGEGKGPAYFKLTPGPRGAVRYGDEDLDAYTTNCRIVPSEAA